MLQRWRLLWAWWTEHSNLKREALGNFSLTRDSTTVPGNCDEINNIIMEKKKLIASLGLGHKM